MKEHPVNSIRIMEGSPHFSGSIFDFGIWNCIKTEGKNFWTKGIGNNIYDSISYGVNPVRRITKTKEQLTQIWILGVFGIFGLHFFSVGRFITGSLRFLYGALMFFIGIAVTYDYWDRQDVDPLRIMLVFFAAAFIPALIDIIMIRTGRFRDVFMSLVR